LTKKCINWLNNNYKASPKLVFDLEEVEKNFIKFNKNFSEIIPYYAVKANPNKKILSLLNRLGSHFDCASIKEIQSCNQLKVASHKISFGNTIKKSDDIKKAYRLGVNLYAFDCEEELEKIAIYAPTSKVYCRIQVPNGGAEWPLSKKFGCTPKLAEKLLIKAKELNLNPVGLSFHVGSQQLSNKTWEKALSISSKVYKNFYKKNQKLNFLNIGGGVPALYKNSKFNFTEYANNINILIKRYFAEATPEKIIAEPGRFLVASAGILECEIILIKNHNSINQKWIYLDVGRYSGLAETEGEAIKYNIETVKNKKGKKRKYIIAGPSCDSHDVLYKKNLYVFPDNIKIGDRIRIFPAGAYTISYESDFNGIKKIKQIFLN
tara:strand:+ start:1229 stop:2362 length:1134 start_codon:yes stop_codon:yes gene_type:complete